MVKNDNHIDRPFFKADEVNNKTTDQLQAELAENKYLMEHGTAMFVEKLKAELAKHRWIPVGEGLPDIITSISHPHSKEVLLLRNGRELGCGSYEQDGGWLINCSYQSQNIYQNEVTHWKPIILPEQALTESEEPK